MLEFLIRGFLVRDVINSAFISNVRVLEVMNHNTWLFVIYIHAFYMLPRRHRRPLRRRPIPEAFGHLRHQ